VTDYFYDMDLVVDPLNPANVVANGQVSIFDPADTTGATLLALKDPSGLPLPNPLTSNANGFLPPRIAQVPQTMWKSGGFTGYFNSYKGLRDEAVGAVAAAQTAANSASAAANEVVTTAAVDGSGSLVLTKASGAQVNAGPVKGAKGDKGDKGDKGLDGSNVLPTDDAIEQAIKTAGTKTATALSATYATAFPASTITYNPDGSVATVTDDGITTSYTYNTDGTVATDSRTVNGVTTTRNYGYTNGNLTSITKAA
jgi:YD repeat-containing protein